VTELTDRLTETMGMAGPKMETEVMHGTPENKEP